MSIKEKVRFIPPYAVVPFFGTIILHFVTYNGTKLLTDSRPHTDISCSVDALVPLDPDWVLIYVTSFFFWIAGLVLISWADKHSCYEQFGSVLAAELICMVTFLAFPTTMVRPELPQEGYAASLLAQIYAADAPTNIFPSMHCLMSWLCFRAALRSKRLGAPVKIISGIFAVLICLSTLFVKQHVFWDVLAGIAAAEAAILLSHRLKLYMVFNNLEKIF